MSRPSDDHEIRRITLPSGRSIEVVRFAEPGAGLRRLHLCPDCDSNLVQPRDWHPAGESRWVLTLECPNCGWLETDTYSSTEVELLEEQIEDGVTEMLAALRRLSAANLTNEVNRFVEALDRNLILPEDF